MSRAAVSPVERRTSGWESERPDQGGRRLGRSAARSHDAPVGEVRLLEELHARQPALGGRDDARRRDRGIPDGGERRVDVHDHFADPVGQADHVHGVRTAFGLVGLRPGHRCRCPGRGRRPSRRGWRRRGCRRSGPGRRTGASCGRRPRRAARGPRGSSRPRAGGRRRRRRGGCPPAAIAGTARSAPMIASGVVTWRGFLAGEQHELVPPAALDAGNHDDGTGPVAVELRELLRVAGVLTMSTTIHFWTWVEPSIGMPSWERTGLRPPSHATHPLGADGVLAAVVDQDGVHVVRAVLDPEGLGVEPDVDQRPAAGRPPAAGLPSRAGRTATCRAGPAAGWPGRPRPAAVPCGRSSGRRCPSAFPGPAGP